eukprot:m.103222 g.103222  ORF g.103222 m.103222 type:complete len:530 (+) comp27483_c1_seq1:160-1749(+)
MMLATPSSSVRVHHAVRFVMLVNVLVCDRASSSTNTITMPSMLRKHNADDSVLQTITKYVQPSQTNDPPIPVYPYKVWSVVVKEGICSRNGSALYIPIAPRPFNGSQSQGMGSRIDGITCALEDGVKSFQFPVGIFEIDEQLLVPNFTSITGAASPNDMTNPTRSPDWKLQTIFLATRGVTDYLMDYCHAKDMVNTRVGFVLSSQVTVRDISYQGIDVIRPNDNGGLCGGGAFETKGCAENDCKASDVNNAGSDGVGSIGVTIDNVRLNDYYFVRDQSLVGASIAGNYDCKTGDWTKECCFCKPNGVRSTQVGVWIPQTRNAGGTQNILVNNLVSSSTQADAINLHGNIQSAVVQNTYVQNTGDDMYVLWGADSDPENVTFKHCVGVNPGILRPNWYGNCAATYGLKSVVFENLTCKAPTLTHPIPSPGTKSSRIDVSMFVFYTSFGGKYPVGNSITIKNWSFLDLDGNAYTAANGTMGAPGLSGKMAWTRSDHNKGNTVAPYFLPNVKQQVNVYVDTGNHSSQKQSMR